METHPPKIFQDLCAHHPANSVHRAHPSGSFQQISTRKSTALLGWRQKMAIAARLVLKIPIRRHDIFEASLRTTCAKGWSAWPALPPNLLVLVRRPITQSPTAAVSNRRPLTHEGARERGRPFSQSPPAARTPLTSRLPSQNHMIQRTEGGSPGDKAAEGGDSHGCFIGIANYYSLMAEGGRHRGDAG